MSKPIRETSALGNGRKLLLGADVLTVAAALTIHFFTAGPNTSTTTTLAAQAVIGVAGLFVLIPFLLDALRHPPESNAGTGEIDALRAIVQQDIRDLHKSLYHRLVEIKESAVTQSAAVNAALEAAQKAAAAANDAAASATAAAESATNATRTATSAANEAAGAAHAASDAANTASAAATTAADAATEAAQAAQTLVDVPLPEERATAPAEAALRRVNESLENTRAELLARVESALAVILARTEAQPIGQAAAAPAIAAETDGPLPPSLIERARAFGGAASPAVSRLIGGATNNARAAAADVTPPAGHPAASPSQPAEDDVWDTAGDMADAEREPQPAPVSAPLAAPIEPAPIAPPPAVAEPLPAGSAAPASFAAVRITRQPDLLNSLELFFPNPTDTGVNLGTPDGISDDANGAEDAENGLPGDSTNADAGDANAVPVARPLPPRAAGIVPVVAENAVSDDTDAAESGLIVHVAPGTPGKPFIRGQGPGINEDIGTPLTPIAIGKWHWRSPDPARAARVTVWLNDIRRAEGTSLEIPAGRTVEVSLAFPI